MARHRYIADNDGNRKTYADLMKYAKTKEAKVLDTNQRAKLKSSD